jgi:hypothetical protein
VNVGSWFVGVIEQAPEAAQSSGDDEHRRLEPVPSFNDTNKCPTTAADDLSTPSENSREGSAEWRSAGGHLSGIASAGVDAVERALGNTREVSNPGAELRRAEDDSDDSGAGEPNDEHPEHGRQPSSLAPYSCPRKMAVTAAPRASPTWPTDGPWSSVAASSPLPSRHAMREVRSMTTPTQAATATMTLTQTQLGALATLGFSYAPWDRTVDLALAYQDAALERATGFQRNQRQKERDQEQILRDEWRQKTLAALRYWAAATRKGGPGGAGRGVHFAHYGGQLARAVAELLDDGLAFGRVQANVVPAFIAEAMGYEPNERIAHASLFARLNQQRLDEVDSAIDQLERDWESYFDEDFGLLGPDEIPALASVD